MLPSYWLIVQWKFEFLTLATGERTLPGIYPHPLLRRAALVLLYATRIIWPTERDGKQFIQSIIFIIIVLLQSVVRKVQIPNLKRITG